MLIVLTMLAAFAGGFGAVRKWPGDAAAPEKEAERLARWLTSLMTTSNRSGRSVQFRCSSSVEWDFVEAAWRNPAANERYASAWGCRFSQYGSRTESTYDPQWCTLSPAMTLRVSRGEAEHYVIVSLHGRVRTSGSPP